MDELDRKLYKDLSLEVEVPSKCKTIVRESLNSKNKKTQYYSITRVAIITCASLLLTTGIVYAGAKVYEKVWKQPEKTVGFYAEGNENIITKEEQSSVMSEKEAREKAMVIAEKFGYKNEKIESIELEKNPSNYDLTWYVEMSNKLSLSFDANGGNNLDLHCDNVLYKDIDNYRTTEKEAEKIAREFCSKYGYDLKKYNVVEISSNLNTEEDSYLWYIDFYKEYNGIINPYERISVGYVPEINEIYYFVICDSKYENNSLEITEEQAKQIALQAEQKIDTGYKIKSVKTKLDIDRMNGDAYLRTTDYEQYCKQSTTEYPSKNYVEYRTEKSVRKVWKVIIQYDIPESDLFSENFNLHNIDYSYYVDATTGEIIGGTTYSEPIIIKK